MLKLNQFVTIVYRYKPNQFVTVLQTDSICDPISQTESFCDPILQTNSICGRVLQIIESSVPDNA